MGITLKNVRFVLYRIQVQWPSRPVHTDDFHMFQIGVSDVFTVGKDIIVHQNKPIEPAYGLTNWSRIPLQYLYAVNVPFSRAYKLVFPLTLMPFQTMTESLP